MIFFVIKISFNYHNNNHVSLTIVMIILLNFTIRGIYDYSY